MESERISFTVKFSFKGPRSGDGCYVDVKGLPHGLLELTLRSNHCETEIVDQKIIPVGDLAQALSGWADW